MYRLFEPFTLHTNVGHFPIEHNSVVFCDCDAQPIVSTKEEWNIVLVRAGEVSFPFA